MGGNLAKLGEGAGDPDADEELRDQLEKDLLEEQRLFDAAMRTASGMKDAARPSHRLGLSRRPRLAGEGPLPEPRARAAEALPAPAAARARARAPTPSACQ